MIRSLLSVFVTLVLFSSSASAINLTGHDYSIVIGEKTDDISKFAADELQYYLQKISSKSFPVKKDNEITDDKFLILVGPSKFTQNIKIESPVPESFIIKSQDDKLFLVGDDSIVKESFTCRGKKIPFSYRSSRKGTLFAVYTFLEDYLGIRWFWPGESGEVVPEQKNIFLPTINISQSPDFVIRFLWLEYSHKGDWKPIPDNILRSEYPLWFMRNKLGIGINAYFAHSWAGYLTNDYFSEHPEYYPLIDGQRKPFRASPAGKLEYMGVQVCTSNPEVQKIFLDNIRKKYKPEDCAIVSISPNDGMGFCECDKCRAQDAPDQYSPEQIRYQVIPLSNRIFKYFVNPIAKELKKTHPNLKLGILAYTFLKEPPQNLTKLEDNIVVSFCQISGHYNDAEIKKKQHDLLSKWKPMVSAMSGREYYGDFHWLQLPHPQTRIIADDIAFLKSNGFIGFSSEDNTDFSTNHLNYYVAAKLLWNSNLKLEDILRDYYQKGYGKASPKIQEYFTLLDKTFNSRYPNKWETATISQIWTPDVLKKGYVILEEADKISDDKQVKEKIAFLKTGLEFTDKFVTFLSLCKKLSDAGLVFYISGYKNSPLDDNVCRQNVVKWVKECYDAKEELFAFCKKYEKTPVIQANIFYIEDKRSGWSESIENYYNVYVKNADNCIMLPITWKFNIDPENKGESVGWNKVDFDDSTWKNIKTDAVWEKQGYGLKEGYGNSESGGYNGFAWYRIDKIKIDSKYKGKKCILKLGAVDESCTIWVNGKSVGSFQYDAKKNPDSWKETLSFDITKDVLYDAGNSIVIRVEDKEGGGGIWKRAFLSFEDTLQTGGKNIFFDGFEDIKKKSITAEKTAMPKSLKGKHLKAKSPSMCMWINHTLPSMY